MSQELFDKLVREAAYIPRRFIISPFKLGEPLLDPLFSRRLLQLHANLPLAALEIHTNLNRLPRDFIPALRQLTRVEHLWISLNEYKADKYRETTGGLNFNKTCGNILQVLSARLPYRVCIGRVATYTVEDQLWVNWVEKTFPSATPAIIPMGDWCKEVKTPIDAKTIGRCKRLYEMSICCDGKVALCCMDGLCQYQIGDVNKQHLVEVFNSSKAMETRQLLSTRLHEPCKSCTFI